MKRVKRTQTRWMTPIEKLLLYTDTSDFWGCWEWRGLIGSDGYGKLTVKGKTLRAHRWVYAEFVGPIPEGLVIDHMCNNIKCVNPRHLRPLTSAQNILRGVGPAAKNSKKTHCSKGHPFNEENTIRRSENKRGCRLCQTARSKTRYREWKLVNVGEGKD